MAKETKETKKSKTPAPAFNLPALRSDADAVAAIIKIADVDRRIAATQAKAEADKQAVAQRTALQMMPLQQEIDARIETLHAYCEEHRMRLTDNGRTKTVEFATGTVSWRHRPPKVAFRRGTKVEDVIAAIKARATLAVKFLRESVDLDKEAMLKEPELARTVAGVVIKSAGEDFFVEPLGADLAETVQS